MHKKKEEDPFLGTLLEETTLCYTTQQIGPGWLARIRDTDVTLCTQAAVALAGLHPPGEHTEPPGAMQQAVMGSPTAGQAGCLDREGLLLGIR